MNRKLINLGALAVIVFGGGALATTGNAQEPVAPGDGDTLYAECKIGNSTVSGDQCSSDGTTCKCQ